MSSPDLALYVTSNDVDHGPLSLKEATKRVQSGEFKPTDLAWHQGVSGWIPMKDLPEWDAMQAPPPLEKKAPHTASPPLNSYHVVFSPSGLLRLISGPDSGVDPALSDFSDRPAARCAGDN